MYYYQYTPRGDIIAKSDKPIPETPGLLQAQSEIDYDLDYYTVTVGQVSDGIIRYATKAIKPTAALIEEVRALRKEIDAMKQEV